MQLRFALAAAALALAACASEPQGAPPRGHGGRGGPGGRLPNVFISPAGKPFRAAAGDPYPVATWFAAADADHDGKLTPEEFRADAEAFFRTLDTNHDGVIDGVELGQYEQSVAPEILPRVEGLRAGEGMDLDLDLGDVRNTARDRRSGSEGRAGGGETAPSHGDGGVRGAGVFGLLNEPEPVAAADTSFDGRITLQEFDAAADRRFRLLDPQQKGFLTLAGLPKTPVQQAIERAGRRRNAGAPPAGR